MLESTQVVHRVISPSSENQRISFVDSVPGVLSKHLRYEPVWSRPDLSLRVCRSNVCYINGQCVVSSDSIIVHHRDSHGERAL